MPGFRLETTLASPEDTHAFAQRLSPLLRAGDTLLLEGDIGAGKTHFARSLIQALLSEPEDIPSPTFTLVQEYTGTDFDIWHADLYRLTSPDEVVELGLTDAFETALCLVEWPDRLAGLAPQQALTFFFKMRPLKGERSLTLSSASADWADRLKEVLDG